MMRDTLTIRDIELHTRIGVPDAERASPQRVLLTVSFPVDAHAVAAADDVTMGIDYSVVREAIIGLAKTERKTMERLAEDCAATLLRSFSLPSVTITVQKFPFPDSAAVELTITRPVD